MTGRKCTKKRIVAIWLILSMIFACVFLCANIVETDNKRASAAKVQEAFFATPRAFSIQEATLCRMGEKELFGSRGEQAFSRLKVGRVQNDLFLLGFFAIMLLYELPVFAQSFFARSDVTPRYSMISYIHRSHGKNPRC